MKRAVLVSTVGLISAGCAGQDVSVQPVTISADSYCSVADKIEWSPQDTPATIHGIRRENAKWDAKCREVKS